MVDWNASRTRAFFIPRPVAPRPRLETGILGGCGNLGVRAGMFDCELTSEVEMSIALNIQLESFPDKK